MAFPRLTFGAEWGYNATFLTAYYYNYFVPEGYRVDEKDSNFGLISNGDMYVHIGYNMNEYWNLSLYAGYAGLGNIHNAVPLSVRCTRYFGRNPMIDRWFAFIDIGSGVSLKLPPQEILSGKIGTGYRISLSRDTKLDLHASLRAIYTHPAIVYEQVQVPMEKININDAYLTAFTLSMAIVF